MDDSFGITRLLTCMPYPKPEASDTSASTQQTRAHDTSRTGRTLLPCNHCPSLRQALDQPRVGKTDVISFI